MKRTWRKTTQLTLRNINDSRFASMLCRTSVGSTWSTIARIGIANISQQTHVMVPQQS